MTRPGTSSTSPDAPPPPGGPRLARHTLTLDDGHRVGVAVCGEGLPAVLVHGFTAEGILYAQSLARLVKMGFKVVAIDVAGHGGTQGLPTGGGNLAGYSALLARVIDRLGIQRSLLVGHSLGGRLVTQVAAANPERALAVVLIDAAVGATWDRLVGVSRFVPPVLLGVGAALAVDTAATLPVIGDRAQARKLGRLVVPTLVNHARRPWRMFGPAVSLLRSPPSTPLLETLAENAVPVVVVHGDRDLVVPHRSAVDTAKAARGWLVTVHGGTHSWILKDPETLPGIVADLLRDHLVELRRRIMLKAELDPATATPALLEDAFLAPDAEVRQLTPAWVEPPVPRPDRAPRHRWTIDARYVGSG